jgi:hypothetical protein
MDCFLFSCVICRLIHDEGGHVAFAEQQKESPSEGAFDTE